MKNFMVKSTAIKPIAILVVVLSLLVFPLLTGAYSSSQTVTIVNNSSREIRHVYFSATTDNNWGPDQLNSAVIAIGGSHALNLSCGGDIKVIAEDQDGCFYYEVVSCSENSTWSINNNSARDCGN